MKNHEYLYNAPFLKEMEGEWIWRGVGVLREEEGEIVIRMYCMREESIPNNNKSKQTNK